MTRKTLTYTFLESLARTIEALNVGVFPDFFNTTIATFSTLILTMATAFSRGFLTPTSVLLVSIVLASIARKHFKTWFKLLTATLAWAAMVAFPLLFIIPGDALTEFALGPLELRISKSGVYSAAEFVFRVVVSAAIFTSVTYLIGWRGVAAGLEGIHVPGEIVSLLNMVIVYVPLFLRDAFKMLSAREARLLKKPTVKDSWRILSTVVGDLILKGYRRAWSLGKAIEARSFASGCRLKAKRFSLTVKDLLLLSISLCILLLWLIEGCGR